MSVRSGALLRQWLLIVTIAAGLVAMHNFVAGLMAAHGPHGGMASTSATIGPVLDRAGTTTHSDMPPGARADDAGAPVTMTAATPADTMDMDCADMPGVDCCAMGHPCQAIRAVPTPLPGAGALGAALVFPPYATPMPAGDAVSSLGARDPPDHGARLSRLSVWRN
jgi:hypothetical protein